MEHVLKSVYAAVIKELRERTDEIAGSRLTLSTGDVWLHAVEDIDSWLVEMAAEKGVEFSA